MDKYVYTFGGGSAEGAASDKNLLGGKGANLAEMCSLGIPVPAGFTVSTECCTARFKCSRYRRTASARSATEPTSSVRRPRRSSRSSI